MKLELRPIFFAEAKEFISKHHRHHLPPQGWIFGTSVWLSGTLRGVACVGRPVARVLDDGVTCEVTRLATDGTPHCCSLLYGACARVAKALGYRKIYTYILDSEPGTSLKASGWGCEDLIRGHSWNVPSRPRNDKAPTCDKQRWIKVLGPPVQEESVQDALLKLYGLKK